MTEINPNNYVGARVTLVGYAAGHPEYPKYDVSGSRGYEHLSIPVNEGYKNKSGEWVNTGTTWYTVEAHEDVFSELGIAKGDLVRVDDAKQETREYTSKVSGEKKLGITLSYGKITVLERKGGGHEESPF